MLPKNKTKSRASKPALTLVELLVTISISAVVMGLVAGILISSWRAHISQEVYVQLQQKSRSSVDEISTTAKAAAAVVASQSLGGTTYQSDEATLVLRLSAIDGSDNIISGNDYFVFRRDPNDATQLQRLIFADGSSARASQETPISLNTSTGSFELTYYDAAGSPIDPATGDLAETVSLEISVTSQGETDGRTVSRQIDNRVYLRNR